MGELERKSQGEEIKVNTNSTETKDLKKLSPEEMLDYLHSNYLKEKTEDSKSLEELLNNYIKIKEDIKEDKKMNQLSTEEINECNELLKIPTENRTQEQQVRIWELYAIGPLNRIQAKDYADLLNIPADKRTSEQQERFLFLHNLTDSDIKINLGK